MGLIKKKKENDDDMKSMESVSPDKENKLRRIFKKKDNDEDDMKSIDSMSPEKESKLKRLMKKKNRESGEFLSSAVSLNPENSDEKKKHWYSMSRKRREDGPSVESLGKSHAEVEEEQIIPEDPPPKSKSREQVNEDSSQRSRTSSGRSRRRPSTSEKKEDFSTALMRKDSSPSGSRSRMRETTKGKSNDSIEQPVPVPQRTMSRKRSASNKSLERSRSHLKRKESPPPPIPTGIVYKSNPRVAEPSTSGRELPKEQLIDREGPKRDKEKNGQPVERIPSNKSLGRRTSEKSINKPNFQLPAAPPPALKRNRSQHSEDEFFPDADATMNLNSITSKTKTKLTKDTKWPKEAQELFDYFQSEFPYVFEEDFSPVVLALSIMLEKGPIQDLQTLSHLILKAEKAFELLVSDRYDQFQSSLETYTALISNVSLSMEATKKSYLKGNEIKDFLVERNEDLLSLYNKSLKLQNTLKSVEIIRKIQLDIESVDSLLDKHQYLQVSKLLKKCQLSCDNPNLEVIHSMASIKRDLLFKINVVFERILHELQDIIFLNHSKCASRCLLLEDAFITKEATRKDAIIAELVLKPTDGAVNEDYENMSVLEYLQVLILSVIELDRQNELIDTIYRSAQSQMDEIMENAKAATIREFANYKSTAKQPDTLNIDDYAVKVLDAYFQYLYSKLIGILHLLGLVQDILKKFVKVKIFEECWAIFRKELINLMESLLLGNTLASLESLKNEKAKSLMFKLKNVDFKHSLFMKTRLQQQQPSLSFDPFSIKLDNNTMHLANSNIFNMLSIFPNTLVFLELSMKLTSVFKDSDLIMFLDECFQQYYFPQVQSQINDIVDQIVIDSDAFHLESNQDLSLRIIKRTCRLIKSLATLMSLLPFHNNEYSLILFNLIKKIHDRCKSYLVTVCAHKSTYKFLQNDSILNCLENESNSMESNTLLIQNEFTSNICKDITKDALMNDFTSLATIAKLNASLSWLLVELSSTMTVESVKIESNLVSINSMISLMEDTVTSSDSYLDKASTNLLQSQQQVPINAENFRTFAGIKLDVSRLSKQCLFSLKMEMRCHCYYYMDLIFREGNYEYNGNKPEPDHYVYILNHTLSLIEDVIKEHLTAKEFKFIFLNIQALFEHLFMTNLKYIKRIDDSGIVKMRKNILSIEQHLRDIVDNVSLLQVEHFYASFKYFDTGNYVDFICKEQYQYKMEDVKYLLELKMTGVAEADAKITTQITMILDQLRAKNKISTK
eukprot:NODE_4_length_55019_cov_0.425091.p1 type:complete len:1242 gc:universal NODE_4_length_55019_cov_0.425091:33717-37442(+)